MRVNIYDPDNIQKGRMILLNIAEDLKADCKMTVSPEAQKVEEEKQGAAQKKPTSIEDIEVAAEKSAEIRN